MKRQSKSEQVAALARAFWDMTNWALVNCGHEHRFHSVTAVETCEEALRKAQRIGAPNIDAFEFLAKLNTSYAVKKHGEEAFWNTRINSARSDMNVDLYERSRQAAVPCRTAMNKEFHVSEESSNGM